MKSAFAAFLLGSVAVTGGIASSPTAAQELDARAVADELLARDRAFGSANGSSVDAISAMFDEDVVIFAVPVPGFAQGRDNARAALARAFGEGATRTQWSPIRVGLSADGQHGFTFGYMTTTDQSGQRRPAKYMSYWIRRPQGWRVAVFKRVPSAPGEVSLAMMEPALPTRIMRPGPAAREIEQIRQSLAQRERDFSDEAQRIGLGSAFARFGSPDAVNVGAGAAFVVGPEAIGAAQGSGPSPLRWEADGGVIVASSGDLGVTWGYLRRNGPTPPGRLAEIPFFTIWRRANADAPWLYIAE